MYFLVTACPCTRVCHVINYVGVKASIICISQASVYRLLEMGWLQHTCKWHLQTSFTAHHWQGFIFLGGKLIG